MNNNSVALHLHVYYEDILSDILERIAYNQTEVKLFVSCTNTESAEFTKDEANRFGIEIKELVITPNKGRDIGPLLTEFGRHLDKEYEIHGHIHTKKSSLISNESSKQWREFLLTNLLGTSKEPMADIIIDEFSNDKDIGIIFPEDPYCVGWNNNLEEASKIASRLGIKSLPKNLNFPVGTMFWARKGALTDLYQLDFKWNDYPSEPIGYDGTLLHAIERLLPLVANNKGYKSKMTHIPGVSR